MISARRWAWKQPSYNESVTAHWYLILHCLINNLFLYQKFRKICNTLKQQIQFFWMVAECFVCRWREVEKFFEDIKIINASMSNRHNVWIIIALSSRVALFWSSYLVWIGPLNKNDYWNMLKGFVNYLSKKML
jgi:hypothetical protein